jgi:hypothetical protein
VALAHPEGVKDNSAIGVHEEADDPISIVGGRGGLRKGGREGGRRGEEGRQMSRRTEGAWAGREKQGQVGRSGPRNMARKGGREGGKEGGRMMFRRDKEEE